MARANCIYARSGEPLIRRKVHQCVFPVAIQPGGVSSYPEILFTILDQGADASGNLPGYHLLKMSVPEAVDRMKVRNREFTRFAKNESAQKLSSISACSHRNLRNSAVAQCVQAV